MHWALSLVFGKVALEGNNTFTIVVLHFGVLGMVVMERVTFKENITFTLSVLHWAWALGKGNCQDVAINPLVALHGEVLCPPTELENLTSDLLLLSCSDSFDN